MTIKKNLLASLIIASFLTINISYTMKPQEEIEIPATVNRDFEIPIKHLWWIDLKKPNKPDKARTVKAIYIKCNKQNKFIWDLEDGACMRFHTGQIQKERKPHYIKINRINELVNIDEKEKKNITIATSNQQGSIAVGFKNGTVKIIDAISKQCLYVLDANDSRDPSPVHEMHYDGNLLVTACNPPLLTPIVRVWLLEKKHMDEEMQIQIQQKNERVEHLANDDLQQPEVNQNTLLDNAKMYINQSLQAFWNNNDFWGIISIGIGMGLFYAALKYKFISIR